MKTDLYRASNLKYIITFVALVHSECQFLVLAIFIILIIIIHHQLLQMGFLRVYTVKNGVLWYTLSGVVEEWPFQHPCLTPIFSSKITVRCMFT